MNKKEAFSLYPNPADNVLKISLFNPAKEHTNLMITDVTGRLIKTTEVKKGAKEISVDISGFKQRINISFIYQTTKPSH